MVHLKTTSTAVFLSFFLSTLAADDLPEDIVGCTDLGCPLVNSNDRCTVADNTYLGVGLSRIAGVPSALDGLSLLKGVNMSSNASGAGDNGRDNTNAFTTVYYLGTPSDLEVDSVTGCAVVFNDPPAKLFTEPQITTANGTNTTDTAAATGACSEVIDQTCIEKLTALAQGVKYSGSSCSALEQELKSNVPSECGDFAGTGNGLGHFTVASLDNLATISQRDNATSNCWPILPKTDNLAEIAEDRRMNNYTDIAFYDEAYKISPILTVFTKGNNTLIDNTSAQLTCLKVVTTDHTDVAGSDESAASLSTFNLFGVGAAALVTALFTTL